MTNKLFARALTIQPLEQRVVLAASFEPALIRPTLDTGNETIEAAVSNDAAAASQGGLVVASQAEGENAPPVAKSGYELSWFDDFSATSLDTSKWNAIDTNVPTNFSQQDYHPSQISVSNGNLVITSENTSSRGLPYLSGQVTSTVVQKYGRFEIRAKLPTSKGMWPAIWLLPDTPNWPSQGEIDIMENRGDQPNLTSSAFHYGTNPPYNHQFVYSEQETVSNGTLQNYHNSFHDYAVEWDSDQIRFYVDDVHHYTVYDQDTGGFLSSEVGEMRLIINTAIGGTFLDNPDASTDWDQTLEIDHVYAFTQSASPRELTFKNGSFEDNGGSLADWSTFGNSSNNVSTGHEFLNGGTESLKLYGQFNGQENYTGISQGISVQAGDVIVANADAFVSSTDSLAGTSNRLVMNIDYFSEQHGLFGSSDYIYSQSIVLADGASNTNTWLSKSLTSTVPANAVEARMALVFVQSGNASGAAFVDNAEFEILHDKDFGDAPSSYPVTQADNGAAHNDVGPRLGPTRDTEDDGQPSPGADADTDDGVMFGTVATGNALAGINIDLQNASQARVDAWLDFDGDGIWQSDEKILGNVLATNVPGFETFNYTVNADAVAGDTFARIRMSSAGGLDAVGTADDGEVEDYRVTIVTPPTVASVQINGGDPQRSSLHTVQITFDRVVDIDDSGSSPFNLRRVGNIIGEPITSMINHSSGVTVVDLTFPNDGISTTGYGSLRDGDYQLSIDASLVTYQGANLDGNRDGSGGDEHTTTALDGLFRKYGDHDGSGTVELADFASFRGAFGKSLGEASYLEGLDFDGDETIGLSDFAAFRSNFGS